jgi:hypothetical protein
MSATGQSVDPHSECYVDGNSLTARCQPADAQHASALSNILPQLRAERGRTRADLAARLKVSRQSIDAIETERRRLRNRRLVLDADRADLSSASEGVI